MRCITRDAYVDRVEVHGRMYRIRPTVERVLWAMEALDNESLTEPDRARLACWHLYRWPRPRDAVAAVDAAFTLINEPSPYSKTDDKESMSLTQDAALVCAAFAQLYGIDLPEKAGTMDWRYFQALLSGITSDTALGGIMDVRTMRVPRRTAHNGEHIAEILRLKAAYALKRDKRGGASYDDGLRGMAEILLAMAKE